MKRSVRQERIAAGQCPNCGKEAAPYLLCGSCRFNQKLYRVVRKFEKLGAVRITKSDDDRRKALIHLVDAAAVDQGVWRPEPKEGDGRLAPKLRGIRIDVERTIFAVMAYIGRPCTIEEIYAAWGKLRENRTAPLPADLSRILIAEEKRQRRAQKRLAAATPA